MNISDALFYGLIQGVTEFIPVSSAAHLSILFNLFGVPATGFNVKAFSVFLHFGTIIAALISYLQDFGEVFFQTLEFAASGPGSGGPRRKNFPSARLLFMMVFSSLPLLMIMPLNTYINRLFDHSALAGIMLILTGVMLFVSDRMMDGTKNERNMSLSDAIIIGLCQLHLQNRHGVYCRHCCGAETGVCGEIRCHALGSGDVSCKHRASCRCGGRRVRLGGSSALPCGYGSRRWCRDALHSCSQGTGFEREISYRGILLLCGRCPLGDTNHDFLKERLHGFSQKYSQNCKNRKNCQENYPYGGFCAA